ncbi:MAG: hypothetical protein ACT4R6_00755 [Gemmatimonadaceae bacterium]
MRLSCLLPIAFFLMAACYNYQPISSGVAPLGSEFRAHLTTDGSARLTPVLGAQVAAVEGRVMGTSDTAYVISVSATRNQARVQTFWTGESVTLPRSTIQQLEARSLNRRKTWLVVGLGLVGGFFTAKIFDLFEGSAEGGPGGGGGGPPT